MRKRKYSNIDFRTIEKAQLKKLLEIDAREVVHSMRYRGYSTPKWVEEYIMENCEDLWTYTHSYYRLSSMIKFDLKKEMYTVDFKPEIVESVTESVLRKFLKMRINLFTSDMFKQCSPRVRAIYMEVKLQK